MEFLYEYGLFLAKAVTFVVAIGIIIGTVISAGQKTKAASRGEIKVTPMNEQYDEIKSNVKSVICDEKTLKTEAKAEKKKLKVEKKEHKKEIGDNKEPEKKRLYILDFDGDIKASAVENLREEITAILAVATASDEIVLRLESSGGLVHSYGLAASQLSRIKAKGIPLVICVDKIAASGGYMMACVAEKIYAAPFAIIGSIGVVAQLPNFHRLLKKNDVDFELLTAGEYKRTLTMFGENTDKGRKKFIEDLDNVHELFKGFVGEQRTVVDVDQVATGEVWFGTQALEKQLIDDIATSDDYILRHIDERDIYHVQYTIKKTLPERLGLNAQKAFEGAISGILNKLQSSRFMQ
ncbi:protease SohB [Candidatus Endobugula sertula]|uniref:Protease SohB n=1 Tax=Candidatus Endobugula sertula TaxID=62101 RepID=A0A1D2QP60_9GAMM|nr:protease SohB [Candidatus Endobugula sertula]